jgi:hypothetical protein
MKDPQTEIRRILTEAEADRQAGVMRLDTALDAVRSEGRQFRSCLSDEKIAAVSEGRWNFLLSPRNVWHLTRCSACRKEVLELRSLVRSAQGSLTKSASALPLDFVSLFVRYCQALAAGSALALLLLAAVWLFHAPGISRSQPYNIATGSSNVIPFSPAQPQGTTPAPVLLASRGTTNESERRVAVVVGYGDAVANAKLIADELGASHFVIRVMTSDGFPETRPTLLNIVCELSQLPKSADGGRLTIFWGGKGSCVNGQAYLLPQDAATHPEAGGLTLEQLSKAVSESQLKLQSRTIVVQLGGDASSDQPSAFVQCLLAHRGEWQVVTNVQSWLQPFKNGTPQK